ncbi:hypothetical protein D3C71_1885910 [compost metagenome]
MSAVKPSGELPTVLVAAIQFTVLVVIAYLPERHFPFYRNRRVGCVDLGDVHGDHLREPVWAEHTLAGASALQVIADRKCQSHALVAPLLGTFKHRGPQEETLRPRS